MKKTVKKQVVNDLVYSDEKEISTGLENGLNVYIRKNGNIIKAKKEDADLLENNKIYRVACVEDGTVFFDFDAYDARPQFKDLLARAGQFLEVKLLYIVIVFCLLFLILFGIIFFRIPSFGQISAKIDSIPKTSTIQNIGQSNNGSTDTKKSVLDILNNQGL